MRWYIDMMWETDPDTGELLHPEMADEFEKLYAEREKKLEGVLLYHKNCVADAKAISDEIAALQKRKKSLENKAERLKQYAADSLQGEQFSTARVAVIYRKSQRVDYDADFVEWASIHAPDLLSYQAPEPDKVAIKNAIKSRADLTGKAWIADNVTMTIK